MKQGKPQEDRRQATVPTPPKGIRCSRAWIAAEREAKRLRKIRPPAAPAQEKADEQQPLGE